VGITVEFYSAQSNELVRLLQAEIDADPADTQALEALPKADLSLHLRIPDDLDALCRAMRAEGLEAPDTFREYLIEQVWCDDPDRLSASVTLLSDEFKRAMGHADDTTLERIAVRWVDAFREEPPARTRHPPADFALHPSPPQEMDAETLQRIRRTALQALVELHSVSRDALDNGRALLLYLVG
jgi:hypothetical protein